MDLKMMDVRKEALNIPLCLSVRKMHPCAVTGEITACLTWCEGGACCPIGQNAFAKATGFVSFI